MGHGPNHIEMPGGVGGEVAAQIAEGNQAVAKETQGVSDPIERPLVLLPLAHLEEKSGSKMRPLVSNQQVSNQRLPEPSSSVHAHSSTGGIFPIN